MSEKHEGGCHCGAIRYELSKTPEEIGYCHCRDCQITSGAPFQVWAMVAPGDLTFTKGEPTIYKSSEHAGRMICSHCGTQLGYKEDDPQAELAINIPALDHPENLEPQMHIWVKSQMPWLKMADGLPTHQKDVGEE